ncbi:MAG: hypothetical protein DLM53_12210 [Candidatus Eremiobacter antarcticus]|nr:glycosyltransferase family 39 protein [Candidatus Eremiobacteraeota bacterium]MBC5808897.1 glycosyltransferase family 39 protein [Candidatus Eremiobacteraeota bacterium]PZR60418.1 MAG: hypothetical protein DLM53_12210 [Candidatus Eremiobacter sp. RRmetagenome_bin22]
MGSPIREYDSARQRNVAFLLPILAIAAAVRFFGLFRHATMPDEAFTFYISAHPWASLVALLKTGDFHPPLIYAIGHVLFGFTSHAYVFRIVTAAFGCAGGAATFALANRTIPRFAGAAALLVAICPVLVFYDRFFRMYALLWSLCAVTWAVLLWALDEPKRAWRWVAYGLAACALLYSQYIAFFTMATQVAFVALRHRKAAGFWVATAVSWAAFCVWLPVFFVQYPLGGTAYNALHGNSWELFMTPAIMLVDGLPRAIEYSPITAVLLWALLISGLCIALTHSRRIVAWLTAPLFLQLGYSLVSGKLLVGQRYLLQAIPVLVLLVFVALERLGHTRARFMAVPLTAALSISMLAGTVDKLFLPQYMQVDWTQYRAFIDSKVRTGDAVVLDGSMTYFVLVGSKAAAARPMFLIANRSDAAALSVQAARYARVWYIDYQSSLPDPQHVVFQTLKRTHLKRTSWRTTDAGYGDAVLTTLFERALP